MPQCFGEAPPPSIHEDPLLRPWKAPIRFGLTETKKTGDAMHEGDHFLLCGLVTAAQFNGELVTLLKQSNHRERYRHA